MESSALSHDSPLPVLRGASPLLRLQSDERLIALTRRGQPAAFEALCSRYQSRLLAFCRHMLGSREDAEDVLQEVFAAAFNAVLADERQINVRPWLYRIARNRSLNHLRRASAIGVDSMDVHFADHGLSTGERVLRRESFRELLGDVRTLPETQRTALLLREIDALSYEQIAHAMETTVPSVKSLLVRARISLAEAAEARKLSCDEVRLELGEVAEGLVKLSPPARRHVRECERCRSFKAQLKENNHALAAILPVGPLLLAKKLLLAKLGSTASAGSAHVAGGAGATVGAGAAAGAGAASGAGAAGSIFTLGASAVAGKAVAGLAAAVIVSAGAVAADQAVQPRHHHAAAASASTSVAHRVLEPVVAQERSQPLTTVSAAAGAAGAAHHLRRAHAPKAAKLALAAKPLPAATAPAAPAAPKPAPPQPAGTQVTQVTTETTQLPAAATEAPPTTAAVTPQPTTATTPAPPPPSPEPTGTTTTTTTTPPPPPPPPAGEQAQPSAPSGIPPAAQSPSQPQPPPAAAGATSADTGRPLVARHAGFARRLARAREAWIVR